MNFAKGGRLGSMGGESPPLGSRGAIHVAICEMSDVNDDDDDEVTIDTKLNGLVTRLFSYLRV